MAGIGHVVGYGACGRLWGHVVGSCGMGWVHVTRARGIWQGRGMGHVAGCGGMWQGVGTCGRGWGHAAGGDCMSQGWICENMTNVKKSKMLTMNEVHKNFNLTQ